MHDCLWKRKQQPHTLTVEDRLLINAIEQSMGIVPQSILVLPPPQSTANERATQLDALKQHYQPLTKKEVEEILAACTDTRELSKDKWQELTKEDHGVGTVGNFAWQLLSQPLTWQPEAIDSIVQALDHEHAIICAEAAVAFATL